MQRNYYFSQLSTDCHQVKMATRQTTEFEICVFLCCIVIGFMIMSLSSYWVVKEELSWLDDRCGSGNCNKQGNFSLVNETSNNAEQAFKISLGVLKDWFNSNASDNPTNELSEKPV